MPQKANGDETLILASNSITVKMAICLKLGCQGLENLEPRAKIKEKGAGLHLSWQPLVSPFAHVDISAGTKQPFWGLANGGRRKWLYSLRRMALELHLPIALVQQKLVGNWLLWGSYSALRQTCGRWCSVSASFLPPSESHVADTSPPQIESSCGIRASVEQLGFCIYFPL